MRVAAAILHFFFILASDAFAQDRVDIDFYRGFFSDPSIIVLNTSRPARPGDLIKFFSDNRENYRVHSLNLCTKDSVAGDALSQKSTLAVNTTSESNDWHETVSISGNILGLGGSYKSVVTRRDTILYSGDDTEKNFRAYSENLTVGLFDLHRVIDVNKCSKYRDWATSVDGLVIPESVFWFEGELNVTSLVQLRLEKEVFLDTSSLANLVKQVPWAAALLNSAKIKGEMADTLSAETKMLDNFPKLQEDETPTAIAIRPLYINPEIAEEISTLFASIAQKFGNEPSPEDANLLLNEIRKLNLRSEGSLINQVFAPSETFFREWVSESSEQGERNIAIANNVKRVIYMNYAAFSAK